MSEESSVANDTPVRAVRIAEVVVDYLRRRTAGESVEDAAIIAAHADLAPHLAEELRRARLVQAAMNQHAHLSRYATAQDFCAELKRFLSGQPISARPIGSFERAWRLAKRNPTPVAADVPPANDREVTLRPKEASRMRDGQLANGST